MKRPVTVLGSGRPVQASANANAGIIYALIPLALGLPIVGYVLAQVYHINITQFTPLLFIVSGLGLAAVFGVAAQSQRAARKNLKTKNKGKNPS